MKIEMKEALVEIDGDEMARVLWALIKERLLIPFIDLKTEYYDLSIENRERTKDAVSVEAARAILRRGVGVKCATITANAARQQEYGLSALYPSPNATIRGILDGTVFRKPVIVRTIQAAVSSWKKPIIIARHAYGDVYKNAELRIGGPGTVELLYTPCGGGEPQRLHAADMSGPGVAQVTHNLDASIENFARCCFRLARDEGLPVLFAAKDTISKTYDGAFKEIFQRIYDTEYRAGGVSYSYTLIDDAVARIMKSEGGIIWACKNYDGDVMSDMVASASGSLAMMTSVLVSPGGAYEYEAAHGTVQRHYYRWKNGETPSSNPAALIFAWTGALSKRAELDDNAALSAFSRRLESAVIDTIERGAMTGDLAALASVRPPRALNSWEFIDAVQAAVKALS
jgi:isocitrate dehydrogenase